MVSALFYARLIICEYEHSRRQEQAELVDPLAQPLTFNCSDVKSARLFKQSN